MIKETIKKIVNESLPPHAAVKAVVVAVDTDANTCDVQPLDDDAPKILDVRLKAVIDDTAFGFLVYPKVGSHVVVASLESGESYYVAQFGEIEKLHVNMKKFEMLVIDGKCTITSDNVNLGGDGGEPVVKGDELNDNLNSLLSALNELNKSLSIFATTQLGASAAPTLVPLSAGYTALQTALVPIGASISKTIAALQNHLSAKVKTL